MRKEAFRGLVEHIRSSYAVMGAAELPSTPLVLYALAGFDGELFYLGALVACQWQQRKARRAAVIAVEVKSVLQCRNTHLAGDARGRLDDALLLELGQFFITVFPGSVDLEASSWSGSAEGKYRACCSSFERQQKLLR